MVQLHLNINNHLSTLKDSHGDDAFLLRSNGVAAWSRHQLYNSLFGGSALLFVLYKATFLLQ